MNKIRIGSGILGIAVALLAGCRAQASGPEQAALLASQVVSHGTSFGMCAGYCIGEMVVNGTTVTLTERGHRGELPTRTRNLEITTAEWERIAGLATPDRLRPVAGVHGCPDCADGGAEWIEVRTAADSLRATFEHGRDLARIAQLQAELRALRKRFP
jgi:hypothetical protein